MSGENKNPYTFREKVQSLGETVQNAMTSRLIAASKEVVEERRKLCNLCPTNRRRGRTCVLCSCNIYVKTLVAGSACPDGHWKPEPKKEN